MYPQSHVIHTCVFKNIRCRYDFCIHVDIYNTLFLIFTISQSHIYTQNIYIYIYTFSHIYIYTHRNAMERFDRTKMGRQADAR